MERAYEPAIGRTSLIGQTLLVVALGTLLVVSGYGPGELPAGVLLGAVAVGGVGGVLGGALLYWATGRIARTVRRFALVQIFLIGALVVLVPPSEPVVAVAEALPWRVDPGAAGGTAIVVSLAVLVLVGWVRLRRTEAANR